MLHHSVKTVLLHALSMTFFLTNARSVRIPSMKMGVTRNALSTVNYVIFEMAHVMNVNKTTREKIVHVYSLSYIFLIIQSMTNSFSWFFFFYLNLI